MKTRHWAALLLLGLSGSAACTGSVVGQTGGNGGDGSTGPTGSSSNGSSSSGRPVTCPPPEPKYHRPSAPAACGPSTPVKACATDADCVAPPPGPAGKCVTSGGAEGVCDFNQCTLDGDCPANDDCVCQGQSFGWAHQSYGSVCVPSNCRTDADCGAGGFCSPTVDPSCGPFYGTVGFYCHTCQDVCVDDSDCPVDMYGQSGYCAYDPTVGHWTCGSTFCAG